MKELTGQIVSLILVSLFCVGVCWLNWRGLKARHKREYEAKYRKARGLLDLSDKPMPKHGQDHEIRIIQGPKEPEPVPGCEYQCSTTERKCHEHQTAVGTCGEI